MAEISSINPQGPDLALLELAALHQQQGRWLEAAAIYGSLAQQNPQDHRLLANQGNALWLADLPEAGAQSYRQALALQPDSSVSLRGLASCLRDLNLWQEALRTRERAAALINYGSNEEAMNRWSRSQLLVGAQQWREAFDAMACRHHPPGSPPLDLLQPRLEIETEQGYGDTFQFLRFLVAVVQQRDAAGQLEPVDLWVEPNLVELLQEGLAWLPCPPRLLAVGDGPSPNIQPNHQTVATPGLGRPTLLDLPHHLAIDTVSPQGAYLHNPSGRSVSAEASRRWLGFAGLRDGSSTTRSQPGSTASAPCHLSCSGACWRACGSGVPRS